MVDSAEKKNQRLPAALSVFCLLMQSEATPFPTDFLSVYIRLTRKCQLILLYSCMSHQRFTVIFSHLLPIPILTIIK